MALIRHNYMVLTKHNGKVLTRQNYMVLSGIIVWCTLNGIMVWCTLYGIMVLCTLNGIMVWCTLNGIMVWCTLNGIMVLCTLNGIMVWCTQLALQYGIHKWHYSMAYTNGIMVWHTQMVWCYFSNYFGGLKIFKSIISLIRIRIRERINRFYRFSITLIRSTICFITFFSSNQILFEDQHLLLLLSSMLQSFHGRKTLTPP